MSTRAADFERFKAERPRYEALAKAMRDRAEAACKGVGLRCHVTARAKELHSFARKLLDRPQPYEEVYDKAGIRLVVDYPDERDRAADLVRAVFDTSNWEKDFIDSTDESAFSYRGYHMDGRLRPVDFGALPEDVRCLRAEIQIHRPGEALWANVNHDLMYKPTIAVPREVRRAVHRLSAILELVDHGFEQARGAVLNHPDFVEGAAMATLERQFLRMTGRRSSPRLSMVIVSALKAHLPKPQEIDAFVTDNEQQIAHIYQRYQDDFRHAFVHQPESLLIWQLASLQKQPELDKSWPNEIPREELDGVLSVWA
jgi:ppGpp synthetase/RelA/SpoT-type nucleotidyltranferase